MASDHHGSNSIAIGCVTRSAIFDRRCEQFGMLYQTFFQFLFSFFFFVHPALLGGKVWLDAVNVGGSHLLGSGAAATAASAVTGEEWFAHGEHEAAGDESDFDCRSWMRRDLRVEWNCQWAAEWENYFVVCKGEKVYGGKMKSAPACCTSKCTTTT